MLRCVLFDIDNTLLLKKPTIAQMVFQTAAPVRPGLTLEDVEKAYAESEIWQGEQIRRENETGVRMGDEEFLGNIFQVYQRALGLGGEMLEPLRPVFMRSYHMEYEAVPGAGPVLADLKARGLSLGIVSNNTKSVRQVLERQRLLDYFHAVVISEEVDLYKPDPRILELACQQLGVPCEEALYVGDHPFDVLCAHSAHMPAIWMPVNRFMTLPAGVGAPEHTIHSLLELPAALKEIETPRVN